jgi:tRNA-2-methylthio-N6-dimethylallyladenosine synthase
MKYFIQTYGCQMNTSDSERVASVLERLGYEKASAETEADMLVLNTCSVKQKAEDKVYGLRKNLARLHKQNRELKIAVTGCMVRSTTTQKAEEPDHVLKVMPEMDVAFRIEDLAKLPELLREVDPTLNFADQLDEGTLENYFQIAPKKDTSYSVFVPIMTGCDKFCTYCIVPFTRGREKSRDFGDIVDECARHVAEGAIEITLVGQTVNSYGLSFNDKKSGKFAAYGKSPFSALLREIDKLYEKGLRRLRFTSPHPRDFHDEVIETMASLRSICPYIHMPVQSGDNRTLRRMNRNYTVEEYQTIMRKIQAAIPGIAISTDIIVGFSGETDEEFENTFRMYQEMEWDTCYISRYSPRKGTYSQKSLPDDQSYEVKEARWHRLNNLLRDISRKKHAAFLGRTVEVLVTQQIGQTCTGRTREMKEIQFKSGRPLVGKLADVRVTEATNFWLRSELA